MDARAKPSTNEHAWINKLYNIKLDKPSIDEFISSLIIKSNTSRKDNESNEEAFIRLYIKILANKNNTYNPPDKLLYRLKFMTLCHPSLYTQMLFNHIVQYRTAFATNNNPDKYAKYTAMIEETYEKEIKLNKDDFEYLQNVNAFLEELKTQLDSLKANENNIPCCMYLILKFGEYLTKKFSEAPFETIKHELTSYLSDLNSHPLPDLLSSQLASIISTEMLKQASAQQKIVLRDLQLGAQAFSFIVLCCKGKLPTVGSYKDFIPNTQIFIEKDLIPNTSPRKEFDALITEVKSYHLENSSIDGEPVNLGADFAKSLRRIVNTYFASYIKNDDTIAELKADCKKLLSRFNQIGEINFSQWQIIIGKLDQAIQSVVWITPLLNIELNKQSLDLFMTRLLELSEAVRTGSETSYEAFTDLFLIKNSSLFNPSDELLYRLKYLSKMHPTPFSQVLYSDAVHCRVMLKLNNNPVEAISYADLQLTRYKHLQEDYTKHSAAIDTIMDNLLRSNQKNSQHLKKATQLTEELNLGWHFFEKNNSIFDCLYVFLKFGEFLAQVFRGKSFEEIQTELRVYAFDFKDLKLPNSTSFDVAKVAYFKLFYGNNTLNKEVLTDFHNGLYGWITLFHLVEAQPDKVNDKHLNPAINFLAKDIIPNAIPRRQFSAALRQIKAHGKQLLNNNVANGSTIISVVENLKTLANNYFFSPIKLENTIIDLKQKFNEQIETIATEDCSDELKDLIKKLTLAIVSILDAGTNVMNQTFYLDNPTVSTLFKDDTHKTIPVETSIKDTTLPLTNGHSYSQPTTLNP